MSEVVAIRVSAEQIEALRIHHDMNHKATPGKWVLTDLLLSVWDALPVTAGTPQGEHK